MKRETECDGSVQPGEEDTQKSLIDVYKCLMEGNEEERLSVAASDRTRDSRNKQKLMNFQQNTYKK